MYPRSGRFTTIPTDANLGNLNLFPFKVSSLFHAKPSFVCFLFWILGFSIWMWAGDFDFGWFWNLEPGFWILKFCRLCPRCWWIVVIFEECRPRWLIIAS